MISFSTLACPDWSWGDILEYGPAYGYDGVEVRLLERDTDLIQRPEFSPSALPDRRRELAAARFQVCGLASSVKFDSPDRAERERQVETGEAYLKLAKELGASFVRVFGDVLPPNAEPDQRSGALDGIASGLQQLGERAESLGIDVLIETHGDFTDTRLMLELLQRIHAPRVGVVWDTHHPWRFCGEPIAETFSRLAPWIRHTHWKDSVAQVPRELTLEEAAADELARRLMAGHRPADYVLFGQGEFPAAECARALRSAGYTGWFSYEWEKAWHPEIDPPEIALPPFPDRMRKLLQTA